MKTVRYCIKMKICKKTKILAFVFLVASYAGMKRGAPLKTPVCREAIFLYTRRAFFRKSLIGACTSLRCLDYSKV